MRILYVDDEADIREVVELALDLTRGWEVKSAGSGAAALALLDQGDWLPDVVLLDVMMPVMDGTETYLEIRKRRAAVPIIFITARVLPAERERLLSFGAAGVIKKPFDPMQLGGEVTAILGGGDG